MDQTIHKEFRFSNDGLFVAIGAMDETVGVCRVSDGWLKDIPDVPYDFGGERLAVDSNREILFSGAYYDSGIAAHEIESGELLWERRDLKKLQKVAYDSLNDVIYCSFEKGGTKPIIAGDGRERTPIRGLTDFYFSQDCTLAILKFDKVILEDRKRSQSHAINSETWGILSVAFASSAAVISWAGGPVTSNDINTGRILWRYTTEGTHAYSIASSSDNESVWVAEQPYQEPPWHRLRRLSVAGTVEDEIRCALGHSFELVPYRDQIILANLSIVDICSLDRE